ncbi:MAG: hypothetical protein EZS28_024501, partial [Streblomastix strix]
MITKKIFSLVNLEIALELLQCSITNSLIYAFIVGRPQFGTGILNENNNEEKLIGTDKENKLLEVTDLFYKKLALSCLQSSVCVDLFLFPDASTPIPIQQDTSSIIKSTSSQQLDKQSQLQQSQQQGQKLQSSMEIAALAILPKLTGGEMFSYPHYMERDIIQDADTLRHDIQFAMCRKTYGRTFIRIRTSQGLKVKAIYGNGSVEDENVIIMQALAHGQSFGIELEIDTNSQETNNPGGLPLDQNDAYVQISMLGVQRKGQQKFRIINFRYQITDNLYDLYSSLDVPASIALLAKKSCEQIANTKLPELRSKMEKQAAQALQNFIILSQQQKHLQRENQSSFQLSQTTPPYHQQQSDNIQPFPQSTLKDVLSNQQPQQQPIIQTSQKQLEQKQMQQQEKINESDSDKELKEQTQFGADNFWSTSITIAILTLTITTIIISPSINKQKTNVNLSSRDLFIYPKTLRLNQQSIKQGGIYLFVNGCSIIIYVCKGAQKSLASSLFISSKEVINDRIRHAQIAHQISSLASNQNEMQEEKIAEKFEKELEKDRKKQENEEKQKKIDVIKGKDKKSDIIEDDDDDDFELNMNQSKQKEDNELINEDLNQEENKITEYEKQKKTIKNILRLRLSLSDYYLLTSTHARGVIFSNMVSHLQLRRAIDNAYLAKIYELIYNLCID